MVNGDKFDLNASTRTNELSAPQLSHKTVQFL